MKIEAPCAVCCVDRFFFLHRLVLTTGLFSFAMIELMMTMIMNLSSMVMIILMNMIIMMMMTLIMMMMMMMSWRSYLLNVFKVLTWTSPFSYLSLKYPFETFLVVAWFLCERKKKVAFSFLRQQQQQQQQQQNNNCRCKVFCVNL